MTVSPRGLRELLQPLAAPAARAEAARALAQELRVEQLLLYVKDPQVEVMLPALGMPKTVAGGPQWRAFLRRCLRERRPSAMVDLPPDTLVQATAIVHEGAALLLFGEAPPAHVLDALEAEFPLLAALLQAQQALHAQQVETVEAREQAARAHALAQALDAARAASAELNLQLRHEHERKDEFLAMLAHELRSPLAPLVHSIEIVRRSAAAADQGVVRQLRVMERQLQQLTRLVDDLLDVSRVSRGLIELRRERLPLAEVLEDAVELVQPLLETRGHQLQRSGSADAVYVNADRVRLTQVFANLLANAAKYTDPGGRLALSVVTDLHRVSVVVQDNGIGIPQGMLSRVFDMFMQVPSGGRRRGGLGIGLTLVRQLVELHGGRVSAYSRGEGQGSTFTVSLPQVSAPAAAPLRQEVSARPSARPGVRVLVVDDNADAADSLATVLACMGAQVQVARNGAQAITDATRFQPDLVLLDIELDGMDGYETARRLRALPGPQPRLVALTGYGSAEDRQRALAAGFDEHLVKPLAPEAAQELLGGLQPMHAAS